MLNQVILVGRLVADIVIEEKEDNKKVCNITLAVNRSFKNENGEYETDFVNIILWNGIAENASEYCKKGDVIGIKGRIQTNDGKIEIVAERVTFLSSKKPEDDEK